MMIIGLMFVLLLIAIPIMLIVALLGGTFGFLQNRNRGSHSSHGLVSSDVIVQSKQPTGDYQKYCNHCGAGLQNEWTHCPQCGAPINN